MNRPRPPGQSAQRPDAGQLATAGGRRRANLRGRRVDASIIGRDDHAAKIGVAGDGDTGLVAHVDASVAGAITDALQAALRDCIELTAIAMIADGGGYVVSVGRRRSCGHCHARRAAAQSLRRASERTIRRCWSRLRCGGGRSLFGRERQSRWSRVHVSIERRRVRVWRGAKCIVRTSHLFARCPFG